MSDITRVKVENALAGNGWIRHIAVYDCVDSTMDAARELALAGKPEAAVVVAARQAKGRGRLARHWFSPEGSLSLSVLLYPSPEKLSALTMMAGLAVARAITTTIQITAGLKWPNDLLIGEKKVAGILVESGFVGHRQFAVIGIGINVNLDAAHFDEIADVATSLSRESGHEVDSMRLLRAIIAALETLYTRFAPDEIYNAWRERLTTLGCRVRAVTGCETINGVAADVNTDGTLVIRSDDGRSHTIIAGDVLLRHVF